MTKRAQASNNSLFAQLATLWRNDTWVKPYFGHYRRTLFVSVGLGLLTLVFAIALMFTSGYLISASAMQPTRGLFELLIPIGFVQLFGVGKPFFGYFERLTSHDWVFRMTSSLRRRLYDSVESEGMFWSATRRAGDVLGLLAQDIGHVQNLYLRTVFPLVIAWLLGGVVVVCLGWFSLPFALMMLIGLVVMCVLLPLVAVLVNGARQQDAKRIRGELYAAAYDNVAGVGDWVYAQREEAYVERVMALGRELDEVEGHMRTSSRRRGFVLQVVFVALAVALIVWAQTAFGGESAVAARDGGAVASAALANWIAAFVLGYFPLLEALEPLSDASVEAVAHADSVRRFNEMPEAGEREARGAGNVGPEGFVIELRGVDFAYPGEGESLLSGVDLLIPEGQHVAVLGRSGAGKSTFASLVRGDLAPGAGSVTIGGVPAVVLNDQGCVHHHVGLMQQNTYLFNQTLMGNLKIGNPKVTEEQAVEALREVGLESLLDHLPDGLATIVDEAGLRFSGGERQRIALARLLLQDSPIVVLDEATVGLDPLTEQRLLDTIFDVFAGRTVIMITHHLKGVEHMDRVLFVEDGGIAMDGVPTDLAQTNLRYQQLLAFDRGFSA